MTETKRIRWHHVDGTVVEWFGYVGTMTTTALFQILHPVAKPTEDIMGRRFDEWALCTTFPGASVEARYGGRDDGSQDRLKAEAERWLEEFVTSLGASFGDEPVTEHAHLMSGGGYHVWNTEPYIEEIYPLAEKIKNGQKHGGHVYRRRVIVVEDWTELIAEPVPPHPEEETER